MTFLDSIKIFIDAVLNKNDSSPKKMRRVFQWRRFLEWNNLEPEEKLLAKRLLMLPIFAYLIIGIFNQNFFLIVLFLIGYVLYKKFEKGGIMKK